MTSPCEFTRLTRDMLARTPPPEMPAAWLHLVVQTLYSIGYGEGCETFLRATQPGESAEEGNAT